MLNFIRFIVVIASLLSSSLYSFSAQQTDGRTAVKFLAAHAEAKLVQADLVLRQGADFWAGNPDMWMLTGHSGFRRISTGVPGLRSILAISSDGLLRFDSYNITLFKADLSGRKYFKRAMLAKPGEIVLADPVVGKQSGQRFFPVSRAVLNEAGKPIGVVMASMQPEFLLPDVPLCPWCGIAIVLNDKILSSYPVRASLPPEVAEAVKGGGDYGQKNLAISGMNIQMHWLKSDKYPITYVYYDGKPTLQIAE